MLLIFSIFVRPRFRPIWRNVQKELDGIGEDIRHGICRLPLGLGGHVGVGVQREPGTVVAQHPGDGLRTCIHSRGCWVGEEFSRQTRRVFAGILCVFQENATRYGGKRPVHTAFEVVNTGS